MVRQRLSRCICGEKLKSIRGDVGKIEKTKVYGRVAYHKITKRSICGKCGRIYTSAIILDKKPQVPKRARKRRRKKRRRR